MTEMRRRPIELADSPEHRSIPIDTFDIAEGDDNTLVIKGYASTFQPYEMHGGPSNGYGWIEQIARGAFERTLKENPDLHLLINHEGLPLARTKSGNLFLSVDDHGLHVVAHLDRSDPDVQRLEPKMRRKDMDEMSFAFRVKSQTWESTPEFKDDPEALRTITEVSLHKGDVSVVNWGANPTTSVSIDRALRALAECDPRELVEARSDDDVLLRAKANLANVGVLEVRDESLPAAETAERAEGVEGPTGTILTGLLSSKIEEDRADADDDPASLIAALDAALDEAIKLTADVDHKSLPEEVAQALDLLNGADTIVDKLMEISGIYDPDDDDADRANADEPEKREALSDHAWNFPQSAYTPEQWRHACLIDTGEGDADSKDRYKLPVRDPDGTLNRNGVHAAAGRLDQVDGISDEQRTVAAKRLAAMYRDQLHEDPPPHLLEMAHERSTEGEAMAVTDLTGVLARMQELINGIVRAFGVGADEQPTEEAPADEADDEERDEAPVGMTLRELRVLEGIVPEGTLTLAELRALEA